MALPVKAKEIAVEVKNKPGAGAAVLAVLADAKVNLKAFNGYAQTKSKGRLLFVPEDYAAASKALKKAKIKYAASDVVLVDLANKPGAMAEACAKLAAKNINIDYAYAVAATKKSALAVFRAPGPAKVIKALS